MPIDLERLWSEANDSTDWAKISEDFTVENEGSLVTVLRNGLAIYAMSSEFLATLSDPDGYIRGVILYFIRVDGDFRKYISMGSSRAEEEK